MQECKMQDQPC